MRKQALSFTDNGNEAGDLVGQLEARVCLHVAQTFVRNHEMEKVCLLHKRLKSLFPLGGPRSCAGMADWCTTNRIIYSIDVGFTMVGSRVDVRGWQLGHHRAIDCREP